MTTSTNHSDKDDKVTKPKSITETTILEDNSDYDVGTEMLKKYEYPSPSLDNFQEIIYTKREYYINAIPARKKLETYEEIKKYRNKICGRKYELSNTQVLLSNFINPNTPYRGVIIYHGTGVGKTAASVAIAEKFKPMVDRYGTKIHVLVPGPLQKSNYLKEILKSTGETYLKSYDDQSVILTDADKQKLYKNAIALIKQYYQFISFITFYRRVSGEKIKDKIIMNNKVKSQNRKTATGENEREYSSDRLYELNNTLLIIDEAHGLTTNEYGIAVKKIIDNSKNLRIVLLTATPMKNVADEIVELINYIRPKTSPMLRDKIFTSQRGNQLTFKPDGKKYLRKMVRGYVSYLRGADPLTFAERVDMGEVPPGLLFTKVTRCFMLPFQHSAYNNVVETFDDSLDKKSGAVANFVFPGLSKEKNNKNIVGYYGIEGINEIKNQLKYNSHKINQSIADTILSDFNIKDPSSLISVSDTNNIITGDIFVEKYLKYFSIKFYVVLQKINELFYGKRGNGLAFIYSNLVKVGVDIFQEVMLRNGYLEYQENKSNYLYASNTRCYFCTYTYSNHTKLPSDIPDHKFYPATFLIITGKSDETADQVSGEKHRILYDIFNSSKNKIGKYIKFVLGSKVMSESVTLKNIKEIHILDVHYNLGRVDQILGRGIRFCVHYDIINDQNPFAKVEIYKYVIASETGLTSEEELYRKAEIKYKLIKETERILQEEAIDCPLNLHGNIFPEEIEKYANCGTTNNPCPAICGYMSCDYKCGDKALNLKYYDSNKKIYKKISKEALDYTTYTNDLAGNEIKHAKNKIKELYHFDYAYILNDIVKYVKKSYPIDKQDIFDEYFVYQAIDEFMPITENDFNNFSDTILDKFNRPGYLIYRGKYYIFQPFGEKENLPLYYRKNYVPSISYNLSIRDYVRPTPEYKKYKTEKTYTVINNTNVTIKGYDFDSIQEYYENREESEYVGIVDKNFHAINTPNKDGTIEDVFKIRHKRPKIVHKKRQTGLPSFKGAVCNTSKDKHILLEILQYLNLTSDNNKIAMCDIIYHKLYDLEKYSTSSDGNKMTYLIIPANHPTIPFPLNLEDRVENIIDNIKNKVGSKMEVQVNITPQKDGSFTDIKYVNYEIILSNIPDNYKNIIETYGGVKKKNKWIIILT